MSIHAADALMEIFGFKRVADDEITLDNPPSLDDDGGSLNEGMKMEEATNMPASIDCWACGTYMTLDEHSENDGYCPECNAEIDLDPYLAKALAGHAVRDTRIAELRSELVRQAIDNNQLRAELAALNAKLDASKFCANVADDLRAELAAAKETITRYETTAENCELFRARIAELERLLREAYKYPLNHACETVDFTAQDLCERIDAALSAGIGCGSRFLRYGR